MKGSRKQWRSSLFYAVRTDSICLHVMRSMWHRETRFCLNLKGTISCDLFSTLVPRKMRLSYSFFHFLTCMIALWSEKSDVNLCVLLEYRNFFCTLMSTFTLIIVWTVLHRTKTFSFLCFRLTQLLCDVIKYEPRRLERFSCWFSVRSWWIYMQKCIPRQKGLSFSLNTDK